MTAVFTAPLRRLSRALFDLRDRVREALAGEVARAVGAAVNEIVAAVLRGGPPPVVTPSPRNEDHPGRSPWADADADPWGDDRSHWHDDRYDPDFDREPDDVEPPPVEHVDPPASIPRTPAGLSAGRWWLGRRGSVAEAVGVGLIVVLAVLVGGPLARAGAAIVSAAADVSAATDALGTGAARLNQL